jgi:D-alanine--poly(phosphoribitol) ligase subunit 2
MIEKKIIKILETVVKKKINFKKQKKLVSDGLLDSFSILLLISKIEQTFKITIKLEKFDINCFNSITSIKKLILKK